MSFFSLSSNGFETISPNENDKKKNQQLQQDLQILMRHQREAWRNQKITNAKEEAFIEPIKSSETRVEPTTPVTTLPTDDDDSVTKQPSALVEFVNPPPSPSPPSPVSEKKTGGAMIHPDSSWLPSSLRRNIEKEMLSPLNVSREFSSQSQQRGGRGKTSALVNKFNNWQQERVTTQRTTLPQSTIHDAKTRINRGPTLKTNRLKPVSTTAVPKDLSLLHQRSSSSSVQIHKLTSSWNPTTLASNNRKVKSQLRPTGRGNLSTATAVWRQRQMERFGQESSLLKEKRFNAEEFIKALDGSSVGQSSSSFFHHLPSHLSSSMSLVTPIAAGRLVKSSSNNSNNKCRSDQEDSRANQQRLERLHSLLENILRKSIRGVAIRLVETKGQVVGKARVSKRDLTVANKTSQNDGSSWQLEELQHICSKINNQTAKTFFLLLRSSTSGFLKLILVCSSLAAPKTRMAVVSAREEVESFLVARGQSLHYRVVQKVDKDLIDLLQ